MPCAGVFPWAASRFAPWLQFFRVSDTLHLAQGCQAVMNDLGLHNSDFRQKKEMNEVWLRLEWSRGGGRVLAHLFKKRNSVKEMEEAFCPAALEI